MYVEQWVDPPLFLEHAGVKVYHAMHDGGESGFHYTTNMEDDDIDNPFDGEEAGQFDVRDLPQVTFDHSAMHDEKDRHKTRIIAAIDSGKLWNLVNYKPNTTKSSPVTLCNCCELQPAIQVVLPNSDGPDIPLFLCKTCAEAFGWGSAYPDCQVVPVQEWESDHKEDYEAEGE